MGCNWRPAVSPPGSIQQTTRSPIGNVRSQLAAAAGSGCCMRARDTLLTRGLSAHVELAENGVIHRLP